MIKLCSTLSIGMFISVISIFRWRERERGGTSRGGSMVSGKGVCMFKGMGVRFADFISIFLNVP